jgi:hypothetical protein
MTFMMTSRKPVVGSGDGNGRVRGNLQVPDQIVSQCVFSESQIAFLA